MSDERTQPRQSERRRPPHEIVRLCGVAILVAGLAGAALIYMLARDEDAQAAQDAFRGRMYEHNLEMIGGKLNVYLVEFNDWFAGLWHGTSLALTVAVLSVAIALGCFWIAHLMATAPPDDSPPGRS